MTPLPLGGGPNRRFCGAKRARHLRMVAAKAADHIKRRDRDAAQRETGILAKRRSKNADRIAGQPVIIGHRAIERRRRLGRAGELEPLLVFGH